MKNKLQLLVLFVFACSCAFAQSFSVTITGTSAGSNGSCSGTATAHVIGGSAENTLYWSTGETTSSISNLCAGTYCVTVEDPKCRLTETPCETSSCFEVTNCTPPTFSITSSPNGDVASTGGNPNNLYIGYGPQSTTLTAQSASNLSYSWSPAAGLSCTNCASPVFTPLAEGYYTFTVNATDSKGCTSQNTITICVMDIRASSGSSGNGNGHQNGTGNGNSGKVYVCHLPPGNPANEQTICISVNAVPAHVPLHGGDHLGRCDQVCGSSSKSLEDVPELIADPNETGLEILTYPNPFSESFNILVQSANTEAFDLKMYDVTGRIVANEKGMDINHPLVLGSDLSKGIYFIQIKQGNTVRIIHMVKAN